MQKLLRKNTIRQHKNSRQTIFYLIKMNKFIPRAVLFLVLFLGTLAGFSQEYTAFTRSYPSGDNFRYQTNIKGDLTFIANDIVNRDGGTATTRPEDPYNDTGSGSTYNDWFDIRYIDIDSDTSTFNSSSADFTFDQPDCNRIRYAALYWSATYVSNEDGTRSTDFDQVKFRVPGGAYIDVNADEVLYDGSASADASMRDNSPYACYADVTAQVTALADPTGAYTVGNIRVSQGYVPGGVSGGWTLVIVYENPTLTGKLITTYDGFARVRNQNPILDIDYTGFTTIPAGPVRANIGAAALEGDNRITGDEMAIRSALNAGGTFYRIQNGLNPVDNFFNSNITLNGTLLPGRTPSSLNTLGYDTDLLNLPTNTIPNDETAATFRFTSTGDQYFPFFNSFNIEIIEPDIVLEKRVEDIAGNDITGLGVNLGQNLDYVLSFENIGNDDGDNYTIRDVLPINVTLDETNMVLPTDVTYTFDAATRTVIFTIPNELVTDTSPVAIIRMRVRVAENCFDFIDACTDLVQNLAYSTYRGVFNDNEITDDPSVTDFDTCGFITPGATNFLLDDLSDCHFSRTVQLCGDNAILDSGDNYDSYVWVRDDNNNGLLDATDTVLNDGDPDNDPSTLLINTPGTYIVDKIIADPCKGFKEVIEVVRFGDSNVNPIIEFFNSSNSDADSANDIQGEIVSCSVDGDLLPKIFLCGLNDSQLLQVNIIDATSVVWEQLDEGSCTSAGDDCANKNLTCTWNEVSTGNSFSANSEGKFRLVVRYQNGCFNRFYFNVFQNNLDILYTSRDVVCESSGNITITNIGSGYGFQLVNVATNTIEVPFSANNGPVFNFTSNGAYRVDVTQLDNVTGLPISGACVFSTPEIGILDRDMQVDITTTDTNCNNQGTIQIDALDVFPNYSYELRLDDGTPAPSVGSPDYYPLHPGGTLIDSETAQPVNSYTFTVNAGGYFAVTRSDDDCLDVQAVRVNRVPDPTLTALTIADIGCSFGTIQLTRTGGLGSPDFQYAIWSKDGVLLHGTGGSATEQEIVDNVDPNAYQNENLFTFGWRDTDSDAIDEYFPGEEGTYVFVILDANNCYAISNSTTINDVGSFTIDSVDEVQPACSGEANGQFTINVLGGVAPYQYSIDNGTTYQPTSNFIGLIAGPYELRVLDSSGCDGTLSYDLNQPFPLTASAGVARDATCDPNGAEVRVTNVVGGTAPYEYSFDGGSTWGSTSTELLAPGDYTVLVRDAFCSFPMNVTVEGLPAPPDVALTPEVNYNCDGSGTITASPSITGYDYRYEIDGVSNAPDPTSNVFNNVAPGTYTVTTYYTSQTPPAPSLLLSEDFGVGNGTIPSPDTRGYAYEDQTTSTAGGGDTNQNINDFQYGVTNEIVAPFSTWISPNDHTDPSDSNGRFLVINVGTPSPGQIIYTKPINDIIPNRPLRISLHIFNLVISSSIILDPDLTIEIVDGGGTVIQSIRTGDIAKNTGPDDWVLFTTDFDPGPNTNLDFVIRTEKIGNNGNDLALDDIQIFQIPEVCELFVETPVTVLPGRIFGGEVQSSTNVSCIGLTDGTITFQVENFDTVSGFEYSVDSGTTWIGSTTSPVTTGPVFGAGTQTILLRKANEITCTASITRGITEPAPVVATANITTALTCTDGATIAAAASGGLPEYVYQLEDGVGNVIGSFDFLNNGNNRMFSGLTEGDYTIRARDLNNCESDTALTVAPLNPVEFTTTSTVCYDGTNNASVQVNVTNGNGGYQFRINAGPWLTPTPVAAATYTFQNLSSGSYDIDVRDQNGCPLALATQTVVINPALTVAATVPNISACDTDSDITITTNGGDGNYTFAIVASGATPLDADFNTTNPVIGFVSGNYDVYVRDNTGNTGYCSDSYPLTITQDAPINFTPTSTDVSCFGGADGAISVVMNSGGQAPFMYSIDNGVSYSTVSNFPNLVEGTYQVRLRDVNLCESVATAIVVDQPDELIAEALQTQGYTCSQLGQITVGSITPTIGGSGNYQYRINGGPWTASTTGGHTFTDVSDGTYIINVRDASATSCAINLAAVVIDALPIAPIVDYSVAYNCDGTGNVIITPFDNTFIYTLNGTAQGPGAASSTFNDIAVGTHALRVKYSPDCFMDTVVIIQDGNAFEASITAFYNLDCNGDGTGSITIDAANYGGGGFQYNINGAAFMGPFTSTQTITALNAQTHNIVVQDVNDPISCTIPLSQVLTEPASVQVNAAITTQFTCNNTGATITASTSGGTPTYQYQLEISDDVDLTVPYANIISVERTYQNSRIFTNVLANNSGESYVVRVRDTNYCEDVIDAAIIVTGPELIAFDATPTACYTGNNDGSITVNVTAGNGGYQFSLDGGPWRAPTPITATTYIFQNLSNGTYTIEVRDQFGCPLVSNTQTVSLNPDLNATVDVVNISCVDGSLTVTATGGDGNFVYAFMPTGNMPVFTNFSASNTFAVTTGNEGDYDVYVWDNNGVDPYCTFMVTETVAPAVALAYTAIPADPQCYNGTGSIAVNITSGNSPYTIELIDLDNGGAANQTSINVVVTIQNYFNLPVGNYTIIITDANGCDVTETPITIVNPDELTADIEGIAPVNCDPDPNMYGFRFINYSSTLGTLEFSADGGANWQTSDTFIGAAFTSGTEVEPVIRTVSGTVQLCRTDLLRYTIPYPLDDLDISISAIIVDCNDLQVTVQGTEGLAPYEYTYSEDPVNFNPAAATWQPGGTLDPGGNTVPVGEGRYIFAGLVPGRTYVFYVRDSSPCVRQSSQNVNILAPPPVQISADVTPTCDGVTNGQIAYTVTETNLGELGSSFSWDFYRLDDVGPIGPPVLVSSGTETGFISGDSFVVPAPATLSEGDYFVEIRGGAPNNCIIGSENVRLEQLNPITFTPNVLAHITCANPGLIEIQNPQGGGGTYTYTLSSLNFNSNIVTTANPIAVPIGHLADATATPFNVLVEIADQYNCPVTTLPSHTVSMDISQSPTVTSVTTNCATPFGITVNASGGTGTYLYSINGGMNYVDNGGVFNNVPVGGYAISIIDANGCTAADSAEIYPTLQASATIAKTLDCTIIPDAIISISAIDGSGFYDYEIDGPGINDQLRTVLPSPANTEDWSTAVAGTYTVLVYDNNRPTCPARSFTVEVPARLEPLVEIINSTPVSCIGDSDGTITISVVDNAIGPYTFEITSLDGAPTSISPTSTTNTSATFTGLAATAGVGYIVTITADATNACSTTSAPIVIAEPAPIAVTMNAPIEFGCTVGNNANNASISVQSVTGGSNTFVRYQFFNNLDLATPLQEGSNDTYIETNTVGGNYTIVVFDDNGCQGTAAATIAPFDEQLPATVTVNQVISCISGENITINAFGTLTDSTTPAGLANYEFRLLPGAFGPSNVFTGLPAGTHTFELRNVNTNCVVSLSHTVGQPNNFELTSTVENVVCDGTDGSVSFKINDPINLYIGGFSWQIYNSQGTVAIGDDVIIASANGTSTNVGPTTPFALGEGEYRVDIIQDSNPNCTLTDFFTIAAPTGPITGNAQVEPITCALNDGVIEIIDVQGGWGAFTYFVAPTTDPAPLVGSFGSSPRFTGLSGVATPGMDYQVWIKDQNDCMLRLSDVTLSNPNPITADVQVNQGNCTDFSGEIEVVNVTGGQGSNYTYQLLLNGSVSGAPQATRIFLGLGAGSYEVRITDQLACSATTTLIVLYDVIAPRADIFKTIDCNSSGEIRITQTGGSGVFDYTVTFPDASTPQPAVLASASATFANLTIVGDYVFAITDTATGHTCSTTVTQRLEDSVLPNISIDAFTDFTCNGTDDGTISVSASPDNGIGPYTFTVISGPGSTAVFPVVATSNTNATAVFTGLEATAAGITYTIRVASPNGCTRDITQVITEPNVISNFTITTEQFACTVGNNANTASISVDLLSLSGGSNNFVRYRFVNTTTGVTVQNGANSNYIETNYAGGVYEITSFDDNGCASPVVTETIDPFIEISNSTVNILLDLTCMPGNDAQIQVGVTVNPSSATPNLEYMLNGINVVYTSTNATGLFTGLGAGNYSVTITNLDTNCVIDTVHTIDAPEEMQIVATKLTDEECLNNGANDGSFSVGITNYAGTYGYQVFDNTNTPVAGQSGNGNTASALPPITNLPGGVYSVRIIQTQAPFCVENSNVITVLAPDAPIALTPVEVLGVSCSNDQGSISVIPTGGEAPYTIDWTNATTGQSGTQVSVSAYILSGLAAGDYTFTITDAFSCIETAAITLIRPDDILATITATALSCFGDSAASVSSSVAPRSAVATYQYQLNVYLDMSVATPVHLTPRQASDTFIDLGAGYYSITVLDDLGCSVETPRVQIIQPMEVFAQLFRTGELTCANLAELELRAVGGTGPYRYSEDGITFLPMNVLNGANTHVFSNISAGTYRYFVRDAFNCASIMSNEIIEDPIIPLTLTVDEATAFVNCTGDSTASIAASADGALGNYEYALYTDSSLSVASRIVGPQTQGTFNGLAVGTYYVAVTSEDCVAAPAEVVIIDAVPLSYVEDIVNISCFGENNGNITVTLSGGAGGYQYAISPNLNQFDSVNTFTDLTPGDYIVIAQDANGCFEQLLYSITEPSLLTVSATPTSEVCVGSADGTITLDISGGVAPYSTSLNSKDAVDFVQDRIAFAGLAGGNYLVFVRDANGCDTNVLVDITPGANLNATITAVYECDGDTPGNYVNITLEDETVLGSVLYALDSTDPSDMQLNPDFRNTASGTHFIAISHANGCVQTFDFEIEAFDHLAISLEPSGINQITATTTGGNPSYTYYLGGKDMGEQNVFTIYSTDTYVVTVADENGCEVQANIFMEFIDVEFPNFFTPDGTGLNDLWTPNNMETFPEILIIIFDRYGRELHRMGANDSGWDGLYKESELPTGDYWYALRLNGVEDNRELIGHFTLYR
jgi:gliding motility-associated-like protein